jgi:hypothetical protein
MQPYFYTAASPNGGPGPDPGAPGAINQWNAWCAPTSASNLVGHWDDYHGVNNLADNTAYPGSAVLWGAGASWQDYLADKNRPAPAMAPVLPPYPVTDIGWFMDTNRGINYDPPGVGTMGGDFFGNVLHAGTFLKDIHVGLDNYLFTVDGNTSWTTGTQGIPGTFAGGLQADGVTPAGFHFSAASAFGEVISEINRGHTMVLSYSHWILNSTGINLLPSGLPADESSVGGTYYTWGTWSGGTTPEGDEEWFTNGAESLGHAVTAVGFIPAGDPDDIGPSQGMGATDWVIVHDNWSSTARNVIVPFNYGGTWVANTNAVPEPGVVVMLVSGAAVLLWRKPQS